jgi:hypothetical protein
MFSNKSLCAQQEGLACIKEFELGFENTSLKIDK